MVPACWRGLILEAQTGLTITYIVVKAGNLVNGRHGCVESGTKVAGILPEALGGEAPASRDDDR